MDRPLPTAKHDALLRLARVETGQQPIAHFEIGPAELILLVNVQAAVESEAPEAARQRLDELIGIADDARRLLNRIKRLPRETASGIDAVDITGDSFFTTFPASDKKLGALVVALEDFQLAASLASENIRSDAKNSGKGRPPNHAARKVAFALGQYVLHVTGHPPKRRSRFGGSNFERLLSEAFDIFDIKADPQAPAEWALSKL